MTDPTGTGQITVQPMSNGHGIDGRDVIFGIVLRDRLRLKEGEPSKDNDLARGMGPFRPNEWQTLESDFEVPPEVLDDVEALLSWAREAVRAGQTGSSPG
jgi:TfoX/Sxy family transcriptional regulator of competence genes